MLTYSDMASDPPIQIATRGSALALVQARDIAAQCRAAFPQLRFELKIIKTTGDQLQTASFGKIGETLPKGLFTKELEIALLAGQADLAVHSLKDLPTDLPPGLLLAATPARADVRDVLIYRPAGSTLRGFPPHAQLADFPAGATIATSSTRRKMQLLAARPDFSVVEIRGNVPTRLQKVSQRAELDATVLALAGLTRLNYTIQPDGTLAGENIPAGLLTLTLDLQTMLPCVGQGAIGIEIRAHDHRIAQLCEKLNHPDTFHCVTAERAFLQAMGGGCLSPVAAHAVIQGNQISLTAVSYQGQDNLEKRAHAQRPLAAAAALGLELANRLK
jgi:hydroxymethylbilane synthase